MVSIRLDDRNAEAAKRAVEREFDVSTGQLRRAARRGDVRQANDEGEMTERFKHAARAEADRATGAESLETVQVKAFERIMGGNDLVSVAYLDLATAAANCVARIAIRVPGGQPAGFVSGFMVSPGLLLTNHHVLPDETIARWSKAEFDYQDDRFGKLRTASLFDLRPDLFFHADATLDFALVAVAPESSNGREVRGYGFLPLIGTLGKAAKGEALNIIQHPGGEPKQLALRENRLIDKLAHYLHYESDTAPGSSGSPVLNDQWEVVALHHAAYPKLDNGAPVAIDGSPWTKDMGEDKIKWVGNEGVRISVIVDALKKLVPTRGAEFLAVVLQPGMSGITEQTPGIPRPSSPPERASPDVGLGALTQGSEASLTIPIELTIRLGTSHPPARLSGQASRMGAPLSPAIAETPPAPADSTDNREQEVARLLALHRQETGRQYYDLEDDEKARDAFYSGIDIDPPTASTLEDLKNLLRDSHEPRNYRPLELIYPWADKWPDGKLRSIYSGKSFTAEEIVRSDLAIEQARERMTEAMRAQRAGQPEGRFQEMADILEASLPYNCEHVVPQSWFDKKEPQRGDLHHLFTCESGCNSFRGNIAYWDFPDFEEVIRDACGKRESGRFEPSEGKGAVARATLYFMVRYPGGRVVDEYADRIQTLIAWSLARPVGDWERHRNAVIQELQGNRNPFIDFPGLEAKIMT